MRSLFLIVMGMLKNWSGPIDVILFFGLMVVRVCAEGFPFKVHCKTHLK